MGLYLRAVPPTGDESEDNPFTSYSYSHMIEIRRYTEQHASASEWAALQDWRDLEYIGETHGDELRIAGEMLHHIAYRAAILGKSICYEIGYIADVFLAAGQPGWSLRWS